MGRQRAMPHMKSFLRFRSDYELDCAMLLLSCKTKAHVAACSGKELAWVVLTSSNLSIAAWGKLEKKTRAEHEGSQLYILA